MKNSTCVDFAELMQKTILERGEGAFVEKLFPLLNTVWLRNGLSGLYHQCESGREAKSMVTTIEKRLVEYDDRVVSGSTRFSCYSFMGGLQAIPGFGSYMIAVTEERQYARSPYGYSMSPGGNPEQSRQLQKSYELAAGLRSVYVALLGVILISDKKVQLSFANSSLVPAASREECSHQECGLYLRLMTLLDDWEKEDS